MSVRLQIIHTDGLMIFACDSSKSSSITMFSYTYKLFCDQTSRFFRLPITEKGNYFTGRIVKILPHLFPPESDDCNTLNTLNAKLYGYN